MIPGLDPAIMMMGKKGGGVLWEGVVPYDSEYAIDASNYARGYMTQLGDYVVHVGAYILPDYWQGIGVPAQYSIVISIYHGTAETPYPGFENATEFDFGANSFVGTNAIDDDGIANISAATTKAIAESYGQTSYNLTVYA